jgi:NAD+ synthase
MQKVVDHIVGWLRDYCDKSGMNGFVVGISGGVDSALSSTLCALTGKKVLCLNMPILQHTAEYERAKEHIAQLCSRFPNVSSVETDLTPVFSQLRTVLPTGMQDPLSMANTRSRLRMTTLYAFAGNGKLLVAGTGNKVEDFGIGFFTKYGDGGVDISPIADLMKSEVFACAAVVGVPDSILKAKPTDGLWDKERTDEEIIGANYDELEWAMNYLESKSSGSLTERQKRVLEIYSGYNKANKHKMNSIPVCRIPNELKR